MLARDFGTAWCGGGDVDGDGRDDLVIVVDRPVGESGDSGRQAAFVLSQAGAR